MMINCQLSLDNCSLGKATAKPNKVVKMLILSFVPETNLDNLMVVP